ncbi:MAG: CDP-glucose 4,6-dehydratase [Clostridiales bacterium]|jgi:CDP-glucose 4,6-dehydratase|nr:CDP-glucose 4,6-dehydratase [Clostridiales bacterium]
MATRYGYLKDKRVFLTGHTGFKGSWLCKVLLELGVEVYGYALTPPTKPSLFEIIGIGRNMHSSIGDVRDLDKLEEAFNHAKPDYVIHMAAQPLVSIGQSNPVLTYSTNVMGTVNIMECVRKSSGVAGFLNVTTDKVYRNNEWSWGYRETDALDGYAPYANSKSCSELVTASFKRTYNLPPIFTARAGNVIGGGDFLGNRIVPDCFRACAKGEPIILRNPKSIRPYQHVLECLFGYLLLLSDTSKAGSYNIGPDAKDNITTEQIAKLFCNAWGNDASYKAIPLEKSFYEDALLKLDTSLIRSIYGWEPRWNIAIAVEKSVEWYKAYQCGGDINAVMGNQIKEFMK